RLHSHPALPGSWTQIHQSLLALPAVPKQTLHERSRRHLRETPYIPRRKKFDHSKAFEVRTRLENHSELFIKIKAVKNRIFVPFCSFKVEQLVVCRIVIRKSFTDAIEY